MSAERVFDEGTALERTQLAWTRSGLALLATTAVSVRLLVGEPLWLVVAVAAVGAPCAVAVLLLGQRRYRTAHEQLWATGPPATARVAVARGPLLAVTAAVLALSVLLALSAVV